MVYVADHRFQLALSRSRHIYKSIFQKSLGFRMDVRWKAGLAGLFASVLLIFCFSSKVQAQGAVSISIRPQERHAKVGTESTFEVTINNEGREADSFFLEASDNLGWDLTFDEDLLEVPENWHSTTTLTVTIPEGVEAYTEDNILVIATSQREPTLIRHASCRVTAVLLGVQLFISPSENIQPPGEVATFKVTIKNIGGGVDNYILEVEEISFAGRSWEPTLDEDFFEDVAPGENRTTTLTATIPKGAGEGDWSTIKVKVISQTDDMIFDFWSCTAKAPMETNWGYFVTGIGVIVAAGIVVAVLWKGPLAGGG